MTDIKPIVQPDSDLIIAGTAVQGAVPSAGHSDRGWHQLLTPAGGGMV